MFYILLEVVVITRLSVTVETHQTVQLKFITLLYEVANRSDHQPRHQKAMWQKESGKVLPIPELLTRSVALVN